MGISIECVRWYIPVTIEIISLLHDIVHGVKYIRVLGVSIFGSVRFSSKKNNQTNLFIYF
jgi:hypothetical protein